MTEQQEQRPTAEPQKGVDIKVRGEVIETKTQDPGLVQWQMNTTEIYDELKHALRGEVFVLDKEKGWHYEKIGQARLSDEAIFMILGDLSFFNRNIILSNIPLNVINFIIKYVRIETAASFCIHADDLNLDAIETEKLVDYISNFVLSMLLRALNAGERDTLRFHRQEYHSSTGEKKKERWPF